MLHSAGSWSPRSPAKVAGVNVTLCTDSPQPIAYVILLGPRVPRPVPGPILKWRPDPANWSALVVYVCGDRWLPCSDPSTVQLTLVKWESVAATSIRITAKFKIRSHRHPWLTVPWIAWQLWAIWHVCVGFGRAQDVSVPSLLDQPSDDAHHLLEVVAQGFTAFR